MTVVMAPGTYRIDASSAADFGGGWPSTRCPPPSAAVPKPPCACLFNFSGSDMVWDLRGVRIEFDTTVARLWGRFGPHNDGSVFGGSRNTWRGLTWQDVAHAAPAGGQSPSPNGTTPDYPGFAPGSGAFFTLTGRGHVLEDTTIALRGSGLYGFGALYGKGSRHTAGVTVSKRSLLSVNACADSVIRRCAFDNAAFGHLIHLHDGDAGANATGAPSLHTANVTIRDTTLRGQTRTTDDLLADPVGGTDKFGVPWRITYNGTLYAGGPPGAVAGARSAAEFAPIWRAHLNGHVAGGSCPGPLATGAAYALTECGLRLYSNIGMVRVINVTNDDTRCGLCFSGGIGGAVVDGLRVSGIAPHGYGACNLGATAEPTAELGESFGPPSHARITRSAADATYVPLLVIKADNVPPIVDVVADVELLPPVSKGGELGRTSDELAVITGSHHVVRLWGGEAAGQSALRAKQVVYVGQTMNASHCWAQKNHTGCFVDTANVSLCNLLPVPVRLSPKAKSCRVWSVGNVTDAGEGNVVTRLPPPGAVAKGQGGQVLPKECQAQQPAEF